MVHGVACGLSGLSANLHFTQNMSIPGSLTGTVSVFIVFIPMKVRIMLSS